MGIREIKVQLLKYGRLTMPELATALKEPIGSIDHIVEEWVLNGKIKKEKEEPICSSGGCSCSSGINGSCSAITYYYCWIK